MKNQISQKQKHKGFSLGSFPHQKRRYKGNAQHRTVEDQNLQEHSAKLLQQNTSSAHRMGKQELSGAFLFLAGQSTDPQQGPKERASQPQNISAFHGEKSHKFTEIAPVHSKSGGKASHFGKHPADLIHLTFHFRVNQNTDPQQKSDDHCPQNQRLCAPS